MIANQTQGSNFKGLLNYVLGKGEDATLIASNLPTARSKSIERMTGDFLRVANKRKQLTQAVKHVSFSPNKLDKFDDETAKRFIAEWMDRMGYDNNQFVIARHDDTGHPHYHAIINRVKFDGSRTTDSNERWNNKKHTRDLEKEFGLTITEDQALTDPPPTPKEHKCSPLNAFDYIKDAAADGLESSDTLEEFFEFLEAQGIDITCKTNGDRITISYGFNGKGIKASSLKLSQKHLAAHGEKLNKEGLIYDKERDADALARFRPDSKSDLENRGIGEREQRAEITDEAAATRDASAVENGSETVHRVDDLDSQSITETIDGIEQIVEATSGFDAVDFIKSAPASGSSGQTVGERIEAAIAGAIELIKEGNAFARFVEYSKAAWQSITGVERGQGASDLERGGSENDSEHSVSISSEHGSAANEHHQQQQEEATSEITSEQTVSPGESSQEIQRDRAGAKQKFADGPVITGKPVGGQSSSKATAQIKLDSETNIVTTAEQWLTVVEKHTRKQEQLDADTQRVIDESNKQVRSSHDAAISAIISAFARGIDEPTINRARQEIRATNAELEERVASRIHADARSSHTPDRPANEYLAGTVEDASERVRDHSERISGTLGSWKSYKARESRDRAFFRVFNGFSGKFNEVLEWSERELRRVPGVVQTLGEQTYSDFKQHLLEQNYELHAEAEKKAFRENFDRTHSKPSGPERHDDIGELGYKCIDDIKDNYLRYQVQSMYRVQQARYVEEFYKFSGDLNEFAAHKESDVSKQLLKNEEAIERVREREGLSLSDLELDDDGPKLTR